MSTSPEPTPLAPAGARQAREADEWRLMWRLSIFAFAVGALTAFGVLALPDPDPSDHGAVAAIAGVMALSAGVVAVAGPRNLLLGVVPFVGVLYVSALVAVASPLGAMPLFYLWPVLQAAYFMDRRRLVAVELTMLVTYAAALQFSPPGLRTAYFLAVVVCTSLVGAVVSHLKRRVERLVDSLDSAASTDPLTGLLNRRSFEVEFERELTRAARYERPLTLAVFDLDHFKLVNDRFGHDVGDTALCVTAATLDDARRSSDVVARLGGEEFAVLFVDTDEADAHRAAARIADDLDRGRGREGDSVELSISAGVAQFGGLQSGRVDLMRAADAALYEAKAAGRHRVVSHGGQVTVTGEDEGEPVPAPARTLAT